MTRRLAVALAAGALLVGALASFGRAPGSPPGAPAEPSATTICRRLVVAAASAHPSSAQLDRLAAPRLAAALDQALARRPLGPPPALGSLSVLALGPAPRGWPTGQLVLVVSSASSAPLGCDVAGGRVVALRALGARP